MANPYPPNNSASPTPVATLVGEYQRQQAALRNQTVELERLRAQVLTAGEHDAANILATARETVRRALVDAQRDLLAVTAQIEAIRDLNQGSKREAGRSIGDGRADVERSLATISGSAADELESGKRILLACRDLCQVVAETQAALDSLHAPALASPIANLFPRSETPKVGFPTAEPEPRVVLSVPSLELSSEPSSRLVGRAVGWLALVAVAGAAVAFAGPAWYRRATTPAPRATTASPNLNPTPVPVRPSPVAKPAVAVPAPPVIAAPTPSVVAAKTRASASGLLVQARRQAWIQATLDGRAQVGRLLRAGETQRLTGARDVLVHAGDAGAVFVSGAGLEPVAMGRDGEVVTRRFRTDDAVWTAQSPGSASTSPAPAPVRAPAASNSTPVPATAIPAASGPVTPPAGAGAGDPSRELADAAQRWLEAYYRRDQSAMRAVSTPDVTVSDDRGSSERPPAGLSQLRRVLEKVSCQVVGGTAVLTGRMTEQSAIGNDRVPYVSWVSQTWLRTAEQWRLVDVRVVSDSKLQNK